MLAFSTEDDELETQARAQADADAAAWEDFKVRWEADARHAAWKAEARMGAMDHKAVEEAHKAHKGKSAGSEIRAKAMPCNCPGFCPCPKGRGKEDTDKGSDVKGNSKYKNNVAQAKNQHQDNNQDKDNDKGYNQPSTSTRPTTRTGKGEGKKQHKGKHKDNYTGYKGGPRPKGSWFIHPYDMWQWS